MNIQPILKWIGDFMAGLGVSTAGGQGFLVIVEAILIIAKYPIELLIRLFKLIWELIFGG